MKVVEEERISVSFNYEWELGFKMATQTVDLSSAQALVVRAKQHFLEFKACINGNVLWRIDETPYPATSEWSYVLRLNRAKLAQIEIIVADCANNLVSALDHIAAALARSNGPKRHTRLYYPFGATEADYKAALKAHQAALVGYEQLLTSAHARFSDYVPHVVAAKELSNTSKHWALLPPTASSHAVAWQVPGVGQKIVNIPPNHFATSDSFEFHKRSERLNQIPMNIVIMLSLTGLTSSINSPDIILECALRYVEGVLSEVSTKTV